jgi:hypothetical protein
MTDEMMNLRGRTLVAKTRLIKTDTQRFDNRPLTGLTNGCARTIAHRVAIYTIPTRSDGHAPAGVEPTPELTLLLDHSAGMAASARQRGVKGGVPRG